MKKTSAFSPTRVSMAVAVVCVGISMPAFAQVETKLTGRVHYDVRNIDSGLPGISDKDSASVADGFELRRARIGFTGSINKDLQFEGVGNAVGSNTNFIDTAFINYGYNKQGQIRLGRFKQPFSIEENTSSNNIDFMERSYVNQMVPGKKLGAMLHGFTENGFTYGVSAYQNDFNEITNANPMGTIGALRVTSNLAKLANIGDNNTVIHLGIGYVKGKYEQTSVSSSDTGRGTADTTTRSTILSFRDENRGLNNAYRLQIGGDVLGTASFGTAGNNAVLINQGMQGIELAVANGPFKFQSEYANSKYDASTTRCVMTSAAACGSSNGNANVNATATASYFSLLWNITGESFAKTYSRGAWGGVKPDSEFMKDYGGVVGNGIGAWQLAYRFSQYSVALADGNTNSGNLSVTEQALSDGSTSSKSRYQNSPSATTQTIGLNWILSQNARVMFNFSETKFNSAVEYLDTTSNSSTVKSEKIFGVRTQVNF